MISTADAPSVICEELPAVTFPSSLNAGFRLASAATDGVRANPLIGAHELVSGIPVFVAHVDGNDLALEATFGGRSGGAAVALDGERVELFTRNAPLVGDHLGADALVLESTDRLRSVRQRADQRESPSPCQSRNPWRLDS